MPHLYFIGVDVGTGSARAGLFNSSGKLLRHHTAPLQIWNTENDFFEQSSNNIWDAVCTCVKAVIKDVQASEVAGIGFDATCSMVVLDEDGSPISVSHEKNDERNVIMWLDHRAKAETEFINSTKHDILKYVGGNVSLEMQCPKLLWLKKNLPISCWKHASKFFDLPDFLTWKCTGDDTRSLCSVVCKWNYDAEKGQWPKDYFDLIGLGDLAENNFAKIGSNIVTSGQPIGTGLTGRAADDLGLLPNIPVAAALIDAHAGALALLGCNDEQDLEIESKMALICGTSSCHMSINNGILSVPGVWGPYKDAIIPNFYLHEAGQSATGLLLDELVKSHPAYGIGIRNAGPGRHLYEYLSELLQDMKEERDLSSINFLTQDLHIWPDFHGNRSPIADHTLRGMISGMTLTYDERNLAILYLAVLQSLAYGTRHILETLEKHGRKPFEGIFMCGGLSKNEIFLQVHSDICNIPVFIPNEPESVLLGAAILGANAAKVFPDLSSAVRAMAGHSHMITPNAELKSFHDRKYCVFLKMLQDQLAYRDIMNNNN